MQKHVDSFFAWWSSGASRPRFAESFSYDNGIPGHGTAEFIFLVEQQTWMDVRVVARCVEGERGVLIVEGTDTVTSLRHRVCWLLEGDNEIETVIETGCVLNA